MTVALSFDFWNTLYAPGDESRGQVLRIERLWKEAGRHRSVEKTEIKSALAASTRFFFHEWQEKLRTPTTHARIALMADLLNIRFSEEQISDIIDYFGNLIFEISPVNIPHVKSLINHLSRTYPLAIISDTGYISGKYIRAFLKKEELLSCFQSTVFSDEEENSKPHASLFHKTAKNLGISVNRMVHTGDLELTDVRGAKSAGCKSIKFIGVNASDGETSAADRIIDSYDQFNHILKDLFAEDNDPSG